MTEVWVAYCYGDTPGDYEVVYIGPDEHEAHTTADDAACDGFTCRVAKLHNVAQYRAKGD